MCTGVEQVRLAACAVANIKIVTTSHNASGRHPVKCSAGLTTAAPLGHATEETSAAASSIFGRELNTLVGSHAAAVFKGLGGTKSLKQSASRQQMQTYPAASTLGLVANLADNIALRPGGARIKVGGEILQRVDVQWVARETNIDVLRVALHPGTTGRADIIKVSKSGGNLGLPCSTT